jgi:predicted O-linked N-acetylglucosamine transferase (SPINDLY family)
MVSRLGASLLLALQVPSLLVRDVSEYVALGRILLRAAARRASAAKVPDLLALLV